MLRLGLKASAEQFAPRDLVEIAVSAEAHGMDSVTVSDHFQPWRHNGGHAPFSLAWMAAVGERTKRMQIGTSVMTPTFRYNPAVIAQAFATMACLYPDRIMLGVGTGEALNEVATGGLDGEWPEFKERFARLRESVRRRSLDRRGGDVEGEYSTPRARTCMTSGQAGAGLQRRRWTGPARYAAAPATDSSALRQGNGAVQRQAHPGRQEGAAKAERMSTISTG